MNKAEEQEEKKTQLVEIEEIKKTPFNIIKAEGKCFIALGKWRLTEDMPREEIEKYLEENKWNIIVNIMAIVMEKEGD